MPVLQIGSGEISDLARQPAAGGNERSCFSRGKCEQGVVRGRNRMRFNDYVCKFSEAGARSGAGRDGEWTPRAAKASSGQGRLHRFLAGARRARRRRPQTSGYACNLTRSGGVSTPTTSGRSAPRPRCHWNGIRPQGMWFSPDRELGACRRSD